ncbi:hypothetical protein DEH18_06000 [Streptomyces sp. NHF165]|nr:hypothetical protein DEH18_06000 [Streptomyces sp. NHF165]
MHTAPAVPARLPAHSAVVTERAVASTERAPDIRHAQRLGPGSLREPGPSRMERATGIEPA